MVLVQRLSPSRFHYGWIVAAAAFLAVLVSSGVRSIPTLFIVPIETEFGWPRATLSSAIAVGLLLYGLLGPFSAALMDRIGLRATTALALCTMAVGLAGSLAMSTSWQLILLWGVVVGTGSGLAGPVLGAVVTNRWFARRRGLVMGLLTSSLGAGQLVFLPVVAAIVAADGWRWAVILASIAVVLMVPVTVLPMRDHPRDLGLKPFGAKESADEPSALSQRNPFAVAVSALGVAVVSRNFWILSISYFVCGATTNGLIGTHLVPFCVENGITAETAAGVLAAMGIFNFVGTTGAGWLTDRFDSRHLLFWFYALRGLSLLFLPYVFDFSFFGLILFGVLYGLDWLTTVPPTVRLLSNTFGAGRAGMMFGWIMVMHQVGSAIASEGAGVLHDVLGNYTSSFLISGVLCFIASAAVLAAGRHPGRSRPIEAVPASA
jgi:sugar phosphate permease